MKIYTDNKWKDFKYRDEVPAKVLREEFDYQDEDEVYDGYFKYRGSWYHTDEFMRFGPGMPSEFRKWDGYLSDSFYSGVLIKISPDGEQYKVGTFIA